ncbi:metallophosphoesterase [Hymenobacter properus]|uniref:Metallophosphoesterase n=1 Tax=Hymenobacter properus TaxID=2791026 RepID=A0A931BHM1_9BACT|nr:metallophosphoesterase [Hymenobacter properus]MBF9143719.1 metallophosphoesterase [Hymenobacter properus]MBR7722532.1 metallophosphoesterase [Microvirga sp. SRT04]
MRNPLVLWLVLGLVVLAEWYGYQAARTLAQHLSPGARRGVSIGYWVLTGVVWWLAIWAGVTRQAGHTVLKSYLMSLPLLLLAGKLVMLLPLLLEDLTRLMRSFSAPRAADGTSAAIPRSEFIAKLALGLGAIPFFGLLWGMAKGATDYTVRRVTLKFPNLPAGFDGFKVLQISDLHTGSFNSTEPLERAVAMINRQGADLILMTGDLVNNRAEEVEPHIPALSKIKSDLPIFSSLGNHDYGDYVAEFRDDRALWRQNLERLMQNHAKMGWTLLNDTTHFIERGGDKIAILGIQNSSSHLNFHTYGNLPKAHAASADAPFKILLSHDPSYWESHILNYPDIDLTLSGHTHGMQFGLNLPFLKWSPVQYAYKQWAGLYEKGRQKLYVNVGLGFLGYPGRVGFLPEITVFELRRA